MAFCGKSEAQKRHKNADWSHVDNRANSFTESTENTENAPDDDCIHASVLLASPRPQPHVAVSRQQHGLRGGGGGGGKRRHS